MRSRLWFTARNDCGFRREHWPRRTVPSAAIGLVSGVAFALALTPSVLHSQQTSRVSDLATETSELPRYGTAGTASVGGPAISGLRRLAGDEPADIASLVTSAERLSIRFHGHPTLTGEYNVHADDTVSIPMIGRIVVRGLAFAALERLLREEVVRATGREAFVTVDVVSYRDVFISGFVSRAGAFPWKRGMTVLHALSLSGGAFRPTTASGSTMVTDTERLKARRAAADLGRNLIMIERLKAERAGQKTFTVGQRVRRLLSQADAAAFETAQQAVLAARLGFAETRLATLRRSVEISREELTGLSLQIASIENNLKAKGPRLARINGLRERGIVTEDRLQTEEARLSDLQEKKASVSVAIARVKSALAEAERGRELFESERRAEVELELQRLERDNALLEVEYEAAEETFAALTGSKPLSGRYGAQEGFDDTGGTLAFEIVRNEGGNVRKMTANLDTFIYPGDLVRVEHRAGI